MATIVKGKNKLKPYTVRYQHQGRQREKSFATSREANDFKAKFEHDSRAHIFVDPAAASVKFSEAAEKWVSRLTGAASSRERYRSLLRTHINPAIGSRTLRAVAGDREGLQDFLLKTMPDNGVGAAQIRLAYAVIRGVVNDALKAGKLSDSRIGGLSLPAQPTRAEIVFPTYAQLVVAAEKMPEPYGLLIWLMRGCGLRIGEAMAVRWENFKDGTLRISEQLTPQGTYGPLKHRKPGEYRDVPVPDYVMWELDPQADLNDRFGYVFPKASRRAVERWFNAAVKTAEIKGGFTPHSLRHIFASVSLSNGVPITDVSAWLGHRNINMTYAIYGHLVPSAWGKARQALDSEFTTWKEATL